MMGNHYLAHWVDFGCVPNGLVLQIDLITGISSLSFRKGNLSLK